MSHSHPSSTTPNAVLAPSSILIIGSGAFGLSTAYELTKNPFLQSTSIKLVDRAPFPAQDGASIDSSRIVRSDYADPDYAQLGTLALQRWQGEWGASGRFHRTGFILVGDKDGENEEYVRKSMANAFDLSKGQGSHEEIKSLVGETKPKDIEVLFTSEDTAAALSGKNLPLGPCGDFGYLNKKSGWTDAEESMKWLRNKVTLTERVEFVTDAVSHLLFSENAQTVLGAILESGKTLKADLTILAAGAWSPQLIDLRGQVQCTAQTLSYITLTPEEAALFDDVPVHLNLSNGVFMIPDPGNKNIKIARHWHGYLNPTKVSHPEPHQVSRTDEDDDGKHGEFIVFTPCKSPLTVFPTSASTPLRDFAKRVLPEELGNRPFFKTRLCHYADTPTGDFLIDWVPRYNNSLFIATGGSGHGFKFLPVIGEAIVRCLLSRYEISHQTDPGWIIDSNTMENLRKKWSWQEPLPTDVHWWTVDGSRCGPCGLILEEEITKDKNHHG